MKRNAARNCQLVLDVELLEDRILLAADPFFVSASQFVQSSQAQAFVQFGEDWKYLDDGSDQASAWTTQSFDDSVWNQGPAQLGYGDGDEATVVSFGSDPNNKFVTTYFRRAFNVVDASKIEALDISLIRDDGAAVYLNGVELMRDGLIPGAAFDDLAAKSISGSAEDIPIMASISIDQLQPGTLLNGTNVLAVEVHQRRLYSSDISFDLSVTGLTTGVSLIADFSANVDPSSLQAADLVVNGVLSATQAVLLDADTAVFDLPALVPGAHNVTITAGTIQDVQQTGLDSYTEAFTIAESQYAINYQPRIQLGDAPLTGFTGSQTDQIDLLWQTVAIGNGTQDQFIVDYRLANSGTWTSVSTVSQIDVGEDQRVNHFADIDGLLFDSQYEYRLQHLRGSVTLETYQATFRTRLSAGDTSDFSFVAYGDSAYLASNEDFREVQSQINALDPDFALLLGDNAYQDASVGELDARFDPFASPEAAVWTSNHVDYVSYGNHDINTGDGAPTELNYSVPAPVAGINATAAPPSSERAGHNYAFDHGDAHFVTFDSNSLNDPARLNDLLTYVEADLAASTAKWKIVFAHHPAANVPNNWTQANNYYQQVVPRLQSAGVDLFLTGHGHTFSWTYPLLGESGGQPTFVADADKSYAKGDGLIQVIAGTGGKSISAGDFSSLPFVAEGFSNTTSPRGEYGFAKLDVSSDQLTVSYVASDDGAIIDSFTINDPVVAVVYNASIPEESGNGMPVTTVDADDLGLSGPNLSYAIIGGDPNGGFAIDASGNITIADASVLDLDFDDTSDLVSTFTVEVNDGINSELAEVIVRVTAINDNAPAAGADFTATIIEESPSGTAVGSISANDIDLPGDTLTYSILAGDPNGGFVIDASGNISIVDASVLDLDFDDGSDFVATLTIEVHDGANSDTVDMTVRVTPSNTSGVITFQQGVSGYTSTIDTYLQGGSPNADNSSDSSLNVDGRDAGEPVHALLRFDDIFGSSPGQIPLGANIQSATLVLNITNIGQNMQLYRMNQSWSDTDSWNSFIAGGGGIQVGVEAVSVADATGPAGNTGLVNIDIAASLQQWQTDPTTNFGWVFLPTGNNGVDFSSSEGQEPPLLIVEFQTTGSTATFQQGVSGYGSTSDTFLQGASSNADNSSVSELNVDGRNSGEPVHVLLRFDDIFGAGSGQIPLDADIQSATLVLNITNTGHAIELYRMLQSWNDSDSWSSFAAGGEGIQPSVEAAANADATGNAGSRGLVNIDVTASLQQWLADPASNFGWALLPTGTNGVDFDSSEGFTPPRLVVEYTLSGAAAAQQSLAAPFSQTATRSSSLQTAEAETSQSKTDSSSRRPERQKRRALRKAQRAEIRRAKIALRKAVRLERAQSISLKSMRLSDSIDVCDKIRLKRIDE